LTVREALAEGAASLERAGCPSPSVDAEWLLAHVLSVRRSELFAQGPLAADQLERFRALVARRAEREPLAYILGEWGFRRLTLAVDPRALIPRPETEALVERCLALLEGTDVPLVLDVGAGSGAIALALADERPDLRVVGTELSAGALALAEENRRHVGLDGRVRFVHGAGLAGQSGPFDLVVSNPPYVAPDEYAELEPELRHEPREALVGENSHDELAGAALDVLKPGAPLVVEVGDGQAQSVAGLLQRLGYREVAISEDLAGRERIVEGRRP
jgi:release factor glutamine methyltransferase